MTRWVQPDSHGQTTSETDEVQPWARQGSERWARALCGEGRKIKWNDIENRVVEAIRRNDVGSIMEDGHKHNHGYGGGGGGASILVDGEAVPVTSVEAAALNIVEPFRPLRDELHELVELTNGYLSDAVRAFKALANILDQIDRRADPEPDAKKGNPVCAEKLCPDLPAKPSRRGRCMPCYRWITRWETQHPGEQAPPVPPAIFELRDQRRVHVSGPDAVTADDLAAAQGM